MIDFCRNVKKKIYIYGCGRKGKLLYRHLIKNHVDLCGFIISDGQEKTKRERDTCLLSKRDRCQRRCNSYRCQLCIF